MFFNFSPPSAEFLFGCGRRASGGLGRGGGGGRGDSGLMQFHQTQRCGLLIPSSVLTEAFALTFDAFRLLTRLS